MWKECDLDGSGAVLFIEFSTWAIDKHLDLEDDDDDDNDDWPSKYLRNIIFDVSISLTINSSFYLKINKLRFHN